MQPPQPRTIYLRRLNNARKLARDAGGVVRFGERLGMSKAQASQLIGRSPIRQIGNLTARRIEAEFDLPAEWLDTDHDDALTSATEQMTPDERAMLAEVARAILKARKTPSH